MGIKNGLSRLLILLCFVVVANGVRQVTLSVNFCNSDNNITYTCTPLGDGLTGIESCVFYFNNETRNDILPQPDRNNNLISLNVNLDPETAALVTCECNFTGDLIRSNRVAVAGECCWVEYYSNVEICVQGLTIITG